MRWHTYSKATLVAAVLDQLGLIRPKEGTVESEETELQGVLVFGGY